MATIDRIRPLVLASGPYARLGLSPGASSTDIKRAYRRLVMRFHPDLNGEASLADFLAVKAAYESLHAYPRSAMPDAWREPSADRTGVYRPARQSRPATASTRAPERRDRSTGWAGGRWYWEGFGANAAQRARRERTG